MMYNRNPGPYTDSRFIGAPFLFGAPLLGGLIGGGIGGLIGGGIGSAFFRPRPPFYPYPVPYGGAPFNSYGSYGGGTQNVFVGPPYGYGTPYGGRPPYGY